MAWMLGAQLLFAITFVLVWIKRFRQLHKQNQLRHRLWLVDGTVFGSLGNHHLRCGADAVLGRSEMVLRRDRASHSARPHHILDLQAVGTGDGHIICGELIRQILNHEFSSNGQIACGCA